MDKQLEEQFKKAFFDILNTDGPKHQEHIVKLLNEIKIKLYQFVPNRPDIHAKIEKDLNGEVTWETQRKLLDWIEQFQAPMYDNMVKEWKAQLPEQIGDFLKKYYHHLEINFKHLHDAKMALARGENIFNPVTGEMPTNMKTGR